MSSPPVPASANKTVSQHRTMYARSGACTHWNHKLPLPKSQTLFPTWQTHYGMPRLSGIACNMRNKIKWFKYYAFRFPSFPQHPDGLWGPLPPTQWVQEGSFPREYGGRGVELTTPPSGGRPLRMSEAVSPVPLAHGACLPWLPKKFSQIPEQSNTCNELYLQDFGTGSKVQPCTVHNHQYMYEISELTWLKATIIRQNIVCRQRLNLLYEQTCITLLNLIHSH